MNNQVINFITGLAGFISWIFLSVKNPENSLNIALGCLVILMGFGGRETIITILKTWKE